MSRQLEWQYKQIREGRCSQCGKPREDPDRGMCDSCLEKKAEYSKQYYRTVIRPRLDKERDVRRRNKRKERRKKGARSYSK